MLPWPVIFCESMRPAPTGVVTGPHTTYAAPASAPASSLSLRPPKLVDAVRVDIAADRDGWRRIVVRVLSRPHDLRRARRILLAGTATVSQSLSILSLQISTASD
jgi:hypothetical protein